MANDITDAEARLALHSIEEWTAPKASVAAAVTHG